MMFKEALKKTAEHRETTHVFNDLQKRIKSIETSETLKKRWLKYTKDYRYANGILYEDIIKALKILMNSQ